MNNTTTTAPKKAREDSAKALIVKRLDEAISKVGHALGTAAGAGIPYDGLGTILDDLKAERSQLAGLTRAERTD